MDRYALLSTISWVAVVLGFAGTWLAGRYRTGWLLGILCCLLWAGYDIAMSIWAGLFAAVIGCALNLRNYCIGRHRVGRNIDPRADRARDRLAR